MKQFITRRQAGQMLAATSSLAMPGGYWVAGFEKPQAKLPVAAAISVYHKFSHADVILGKLLEGWLQRGGPGPGLELVSVYVDQFPENDMSRELARKYGFRIARTIDEAVTHGSDRVPVAGVLSIAEHGRYPVTPDTKQKLYPRRRFFDEIVGAMRRVQQFVPIFNDKHLGFRWSDAIHMVNTARRHQIPLMAGSSLPVTWRYPAVELPLGDGVRDALVVGHSTSESYLFHALEALECIVERRIGGETGVKAVRALRGPEIFAAEKRGEWSRELLKAALGTLDASTENLTGQIEQAGTVFFVLEYHDGLRATAAMIPGAEGPMPPLYSCQLAVAVQRSSVAQPFACWLKTPGIPFRHFEQLLRGFEQMLRTTEPVYPVERTLLTTGVLDRMLQSLYLHQGARLETPELAIRYQPTKWGFANRKGGLEAGG
ncbi:MAG: hypothetical protein VX346_27945 [Planctomycetota bacterium]|nr:hypothetical protein [Planctomycetota bacterium]